jgi:hypothetical protein
LPCRHVSPQSYLPPAVVNVYHENRKEAIIRVYKNICFDTKTKNDKQVTIYFNSSKGILYFGEKSCISTIIRVVQWASYKNIDILRVAI